MKTLGSVVSITPSRLVIVKISDPNNVPQIGAEVVDALGEKIGVVVDIIGPVTSPYAVVRPQPPAAINLVKPSMVLFYRIKRAPKRERGRKAKGGKK